MPSIRIPKELNDKIYYLTFTIKNWYYVLDRHNRWNIVSGSLKYFQNNKNLKIYGFVFMINHIHLIVQSSDAIGFVRDFKKYTTNEILKNIKQSEPNMLKLFAKKREIQVGGTEPTVLDKNAMELWQKTNMPELIETEKFFKQKLNYILENPVKREYVIAPENWYWSSANSECELKADEFMM